MIKNRLLPVAVLLLSACQGIPTKEIRGLPTVFEARSSKSLNEIATCLTEDPTLEDLSDRVRPLTFPDGRKMEISIGAEQVFEFKNFYLVTIDSIGTVSRVSIRRSDIDFGPLDQKALEKIVLGCVK